MNLPGAAQAAGKQEHPQDQELLVLAGFHGFTVGCIPVTVRQRARLELKRVLGVVARQRQARRRFTSGCKEGPNYKLVETPDKKTSKISSQNQR